MPNATYHTQHTQGWTSSPNGRGTFDIIWSSAFTIFLCSWSVLCINVPAPGGSSWRTCQHKAWLACLCGIGPEFLLILALGQWESACRSVDDFHRLGLRQWSMKHAFFADMGGFILQTTDGIPFPLNAKQLHHLVVEGYISDGLLETEVMLDKKLIEDKNKTDLVVRSITVIQILWFVVNFVGRAVQHLTITTMELTTIGFIATTIAVSFFWAHKPADVSTAHIIKLDVPEAAILSKAGHNASRKWFRTPLDFVNDKPSHYSIVWVYHVNILQRLHLSPVRRQRPITRIQDDELSPCFDRSLRCNLITLAFASICFAVNVSGWHFWFPSVIERQLWRSSSIALIAATGVGAAFEFYYLYHYLREEHGIFRQVKQSQSPAIISRSHCRVQWGILNEWIERCKNVAVRLRNITPDQDPAFTGEYKLLIPSIFCTAIYVSARAYLLLEDVISLRALPPNTYDTVNWWQYLPHV